MSLPVVPLHKDVHGALKLNASRNLNEFASQHMFPVSVHEFVRAGAEFPVVFVKDAASGQFRSVALAGLMPNENIYAVANVLPTYLPLAVQNYPMVLIAEANVENQFAIGINTEFSAGAN
ncbi:MAG: SapC family protein [Rheinheimera sp.]|nr:SapC family protein [Rheinheimera sp.]